jgi:lipoprotein signal peptidase
MEFAVFNVADIFVCVGCGLMILDVILSEVRDQKMKKENTENDT